MNVPAPFAVLGFPARPWIDPEALQDRFLGLAAQWHPDANPEPDAGGRFQQIVSAHRQLQDPVRRLEALLETLDPQCLSQPRSPSLRGDLGDLFLNISSLQQQVSGFLRKFEAAVSPLARALLRSEVWNVQTALENTSLLLNARCCDLEGRLREADMTWEALPLEERLRILRDIQGEAAYLHKWRTQIRESLTRLNLAAGPGTPSAW